MSSIRLSEKNRLTQRIGVREEQLGYIKLEPNSKKCVLWLNDMFGVANTAGADIRADEYPSLEVARCKVLDAPSVFIWHCIWMRNVLKREAEKELENHWEQFTSNSNAQGKQTLRDRLRAYLDRLPIDKVKELFAKIGTEAFRITVTELVKLWCC